MHMIKLFHVDPDKSDDLMPFYTNDTQKEAAAHKNVTKNWDDFGRMTRGMRQVPTVSYQYEIGRSREPVKVEALHKGISGLHTPDPSFSLYNTENILNVLKNTAANKSVKDNKPMVINNRLFEEALPEDAFFTVWNTIDNIIRNKSNNKIGLQDIYNLPVNMNTGKTGNLVVPAEYKSAFLTGVNLADNKLFESSLGTDPADDMFNTPIILPKDDSYYYTNGRSPNDKKYTNLLLEMAMMAEDNDNSSMPWLVDVDTSVFSRDDRYNKELEAQVDNPSEMVARSITPKKGITFYDTEKAIESLNKANKEDREKVAQEHIGKLFNIDPIEVSDEKYKNIIEDMSNDYISDWLRALRRRK